VVFLRPIGQKRHNIDDDIVLICMNRMNNIDAAGWHTVMNGLANVTSIKLLNGIEGLGGLFAGNETEAVLGGKRIVEYEGLEVVLRLLLRNQKTLEKVDLRWVWMPDRLKMGCQFA
jgi:hypothetical protein